MNHTTNQIKKNAVHAFETAQNFINISLENIEKITSLQLELSRNNLEETSNAIKNLSKISNPQDLFSHLNKFTNSAVERNLNSYRDIYEVITSTQGKISKLVETESSKFKIDTSANPMSAWLNKFQTAKFDSANFSMNSFMSSANKTMQNVSKLANEAAALTENHLLSASETVKSVVKTAQTAAEQTVVTAKKAATDTMNTAKLAAAENMVIAKKAATETAETVINSAKKAQENVVEVAKKTADVVVAATTHASTVAASVKKPAVKTVRTTAKKAAK